MSTRIHRAIGYAMPTEAFYDHQLLGIDPEECLGDELEDRLGGYTHLAYGGDDRLYHLIDSGIITRDSGPHDLIMQVGCGDDRDHVLFFPNQALKAEWYRFDHTVDWVFSLDEQRFPIADIEYLDYRLPPFYHVAIPEHLRWWLLHVGLFDGSGVAELRPMKAQWWS